MKDSFQTSLAHIISRLARHFVCLSDHDQCMHFIYRNITKLWEWKLFRKVFVKIYLQRLDKEEKRSPLQRQKSRERSEPKKMVVVGKIWSNASLQNHRATSKAEPFSTIISACLKIPLMQPESRFVREVGGGCGLSKEVISSSCYRAATLTI